MNLLRGLSGALWVPSNCFSEFSSLVRRFIWASKLVPAYYANYQFQDAVKDEATRETYTTKTEDEIRESLFKKAQELRYSLDPRRNQGSAPGHNSTARS